MTHDGVWTHDLRMSWKELATLWPLSYMNHFQTHIFNKYESGIYLLKYFVNYFLKYLIIYWLLVFQFLEFELTRFYSTHAKKK